MFRPRPWIDWHCHARKSRHLRPTLLQLETRVAPATLRTPGGLGIMVPAYFYPTAGGGWDQMASAAGQVPLTAILNPNSGPGTAFDPTYGAAVDKLRAAGGAVIGYVHTSYGARALSDVEADINAYNSFYHLDGIFIDEMASDNGAQDLAYYQQVYSYIHTLQPSWMVVGNPGTNTDAAYASTPDADNLVLFEDGSGYDTYTPPSWQAFLPAQRFTNIAYDVAAATMPGYVNLAASRHVGWVYVTDENLPNPYAGLPSYWSALVADVAAARTGPVIVNASSYTITGTAPANSLVQVYVDLNGDGQIDGADHVVASEQLTAGNPNFVIANPLTANVDNHFLVTTTFGGVQSAPTVVPTITEDSQQPAVTMVSPDAGPLAGGTQVTVTGTNLGLPSPAEVDFGPGNPGVIVSDNGSTIVATDPAGSAGPVDVTVTTVAGTSAMSAADQFSYVGLVNGNLVVDDTARNDAIALRSLGAGQVEVTFNGNDAGTYTLAAGNSVQVQTTAGDDTVSVNDATLPVSVTGGKGHTTLDLSGTAGPNLWTLTSTNTGSVGSLTFTGITGVIGSGHDTLTGPAASNTWNVNAANAGTLDGGLSFTGMPNLTGGAGNDTFTFGPSGSIGKIDGGAGTNTLDYSSYGTRSVVDLTHGVATAVSNYAYHVIANIQAALGSSNATNLLVGSPANTLWNITGANSGTATPTGGATFTFSNFPTLAGGAGNDTFKFTGASASETGYIDGGAGANTFDYSAYPGTIIVNVAADAATAVKSLNGSGAFNIRNFIGNTTGTNHLVGPNTTDTWGLTGANAGTFMGTGSFSGFPNLTGGTGADTFHFAAGASLSGYVDGGLGAGLNTLDYSSYNARAVVDLTHGVATAVSNYAYHVIADFQAALGSSSTTNLLVGTPANTLWSITGANSGTATPTGGAVFTFSSFPTLAGGAGNDTFKFASASASETGYIDGGAGANTFDYSAYPGTIVVNVGANAATAVKSLNGGGAFEIQNFIGNTTSTNHLVGPNTTDVWNLTGVNAGTFMTTGSFTGFPNVTGGSGDDTYHFAVGASLSGTLGDSGGHNWLDYSAWTNAVVVNLTSGAASGVTGNVSGVQNVIGGAAADTITGDATGGILIGGAGTDTITAGAGRSILIGDAGNDKLTAGTNGDILIGGGTSYDNPTLNKAALVAVLAEWQRTDINYTARITDLRSGTGLTQGNKLTWGTSVLDDNASNNFTGNASASGNELDWFFANQAAGHDTVVNLLAGEQVN